MCLCSAASRRSAIHYPIVLTGNSFSFVIFVINNQTAVGLLYHVRKFTEHNCFKETNPPPFSGTKNNPCPGTEDNCISCFMQRKLEWSVSRFLLGNVALAILTDDLSGFYTFTFTFTFTSTFTSTFSFNSFHPGNPLFKGCW